MIWVLGIVLVAVLGVVAAAAAGRFGAMEEAHDDRFDQPLPRGPLSAADVRGVRFPLGLRGYRMAEVDTLLARLARQLEDAERRAAETASPLPPRAGAGEAGGTTPHDSPVSPEAQSPRVD